MAERSQETHAVGLVQRFDNAYLICRPVGGAGDDAPWDFPRGPLQPGESAEAAMRRLGQTLLGMRLEIDIGMPPVAGMLDGWPVILRYFFCGVLGEQQGFATPVESRWVGKTQLLQTTVHPLHREVLDWLREQPA